MLYTPSSDIWCSRQSSCDAARVLCPLVDADSNELCLATHHTGFKISGTNLHSRAALREDLIGPSPFADIPAQRLGDLCFCLAWLSNVYRPRCFVFQPLQLPNESVFARANFARNLLLLRFLRSTAEVNSSGWALVRTVCYRIQMCRKIVSE